MMVLLLLFLSLTSSVCALPFVSSYKSQTPEQNISALQKAQVDNPKDPHINYNLGVALYKKGEYAQAQENFKRVIDAQKVGYNLAQHARFNRGNSFYKNTLALLPDNWQEQKELDQKLLQRAMQELTPALDVFKAFLEKNENNTDELEKQKSQERGQENLKASEELLKKLQEKLQQQQQQKQEKDQDKDQQDKKDKDDKKQDKKEQQKDNQKNKHNDQSSQDKDKNNQEQNNQDQQDKQGGEQEQKDQHGDKDQQSDSQQDKNKQESGDKQQKEQQGDEKKDSGQQENDKKDNQDDQKQANAGDEEEKADQQKKQAAAAQAAPAQQESMKRKAMRAMLENLQDSESKLQKGLIYQQMKQQKRQPAPGQRPW